MKILMRADDKIRSGNATLKNVTPLIRKKNDSDYKRTEKSGMMKREDK